MPRYFSIYQCNNLLMCVLQQLLVPFRAIKRYKDIKEYFHRLSFNLRSSSTICLCLYLLVTGILDIRHLILLLRTLIFMSFDSSFKELYNDIKIYEEKHWLKQSPLTILVFGTRFSTFSPLCDSFLLEI